MSYIVSVEPVHNQTGFLTLNSNGAILASGGDLENDERKADIMFRLISMQPRVDSYIQEGCTRLSIYYKGFAYVICLSNKKIHVIKKKLERADDLSYDLNTDVSTANSINA